jgi:sulfoxide reductase heme-binding subunit YedZ
VSDQVLWFVSRGSGVVSLLLSTAVVCFGFLIVGRWSRPSWPRFLTVELHRRIALVSIIFVGLHIATAILDPFTKLGLVAAIVPLASSYRPAAVGMGVVSLDLTLALIVTSLLRERIGHRTWRAVHWLAYGAWPMAVAHSLTAGSDAFAAWMLVLTGLCVVAVLGSLAWRAIVGGELRTELPAVVASPSRLPAARRRSRT